LGFGLGLSLRPAALHAQDAGAAPAEDALAVANAEIAQRLLRAAQKPRCGVPAADGSIVVCGGREASDRERLPLREELDSARSTRDGLPRAPNVSGMRDCSRGCIGIGGVPAPMYYFDITALPEAPPDSDADRIARGEIRAP
jgi:hypothetical protein